MEIQWTQFTAKAAGWSSNITCNFPISFSDTSWEWILRVYDPYNSVDGIGVKMKVKNAGSCEFSCLNIDDVYTKLLFIFGK